MWFNRFVYITISAAAVAAFLLTDSSAALFLCLCLAALPPVSFVLLSIAVKRVKFDYEIREACMRGKPLDITLSARLSPRFLAGAVHVVLEIENSTFHKTARKKFVFRDLSGATHVYDYVSADSGRIAVRVKSVRLLDIFGVFALGVRCHKFAESIVSPVLYEGVSVSLSAGRAAFLGDVTLPEKGNDSTEVFNVRDYAAGDSLHSIHWKLSCKFDSLKTKEYGSSYDRQTLILVDMSRRKYKDAASDEQLNGVLDAAVTLSNALKEEGCVHSVGWFEEGTFYSSEVSDGATFVQTVFALMSIKVNETNEQTLLFSSRTPACAAFTKIVFITAAVSAEELRLHADLGVTALCVGASSGETEENGVKIVYTTYKDLGAQLARCVL